MQVELVERTGELGAIDESLALAEQGLGRLLVVSGPAGIGKSALLRASGELAVARGFKLLAASGSEMERKFPFGVVRQLYGSLAAGEKRSGEAATAMEAVFGAPRRAATSDVSFQTLDGLYWLVADNAQEGPLAIVVDDAQWADEPSLQHLHYLSRRFEAMGVLVLLARRSGEPPPAALEDLFQRSVATIKPGPLGSSGVEELIERGLGRTPATKYVQACLDQTGGYPLYVMELLRSARERDVEPDETAATEVENLDAEGLGHHVWRRIEAIGPEAGTVAELVAILGDQAEIGRIAQLGKLEPAQVVEVVDRLVGQGVLRDDGGLRCAHPIVGDAIEGRLPGARRDAWYRAAAHLLLDEGVDIREVSGFLLECRPSGEGWVVERLRELGKAAMGSGAPGLAKVALTRALAEPPPEEVLVSLLQELAHAEDASGDPESALKHLAEALERTKDPRQSAEIAIAQGQILTFLSRHEEAVAALEVGAGQLRGRDPDLQRRVEADRIACLLVSQRGAIASDLESLSADWTGDHDSATEMAILTARSMHAVLSSRPAGEVAALAERALRTGGLGDGALNIEIWTMATWLLIFSDRADLAWSLTEGELARARPEGHVRRIYALETALASAALHRGDIPTAVSAAQGALAVTDSGPQVSWALWNLTLALLEAGDLGAAELALDAAEPGHWSLDEGGSHGLHFARAKLRLAQGRLEDAAADLDFMIDGSQAFPAGLRGLDDLWRWVGAVLAHLRGETERARSVALEELEYARGLISNGYLGRTLRIAALVGAGDEMELLDESVERLRSSGCRLEEARSLVEMGAALRRRGDRVAARKPLREGLDLAYRCGGGAVVSQALAELRAAGGRPRRMVLEGPDALTPREARMAQMAAHGRSNREIAQELYVTLATVEGTLWRAYAKLDISGRGARQALPQALGSLYGPPEAEGSR
jgi:DNA-binding CsgD family transcriptional regulator